MVLRSGWVLAALFCFIGCNKSEKSSTDEPAKETEKVASSTTKIERWATPPTLGAKLGEKTGGDFAKIDPWGGSYNGGIQGLGDKGAPGGGPSRAPTFADKVDLSKLDKQAEEPGSAIQFKNLQGETSAGTGFRVKYNPSKNATHEQYKALFEKQRVFEEIAEGLNKTVRIPSAVDINTVDCNTINAFYDPNNKRIIVCYELVSYFLDMFKPTAKNDAELGNAVLGALIFSFFHEAGHGLIDILELPAVGREEDSVDQLATLILISSGDEGVQMALSGAYWFHLQSEGGHKTPFWDEHAFDGQRFYNIMCLIYGSNPKKYSEFVTSGNLPKDRAVRCSDEYAKINKAWEKLLGPHLTNGAAFNINYKPKVPVAEAPTKTSEDPWGGEGTNGEAPEAAKAPPPPPPPPAKTEDDVAERKPRSSITCEQVAQKAGELIAEEARSRANGDETVLESVDEKLKTELPAVVEQILAECAKANWPEASRKCVMKAKNLAAATKCN